MKVPTLEALAPLLDILRAHPALEEARPGEFRLHGRDFLHFHESSRGTFADVLLAKGRIHMRVSTATEQGELLERIDQVLESLALRERKLERRRGASRGP
jgi:hypothetical protein